MSACMVAFNWLMSEGDNWCWQTNRYSPAGLQRVLWISTQRRVKTEKPSLDHGCFGFFFYSPRWPASCSFSPRHRALICQPVCSSQSRCSCCSSITTRSELSGVLSGAAAAAAPVGRTQVTGYIRRYRGRQRKRKRAPPCGCIMNCIY